MWICVSCGEPNAGTPERCEVCGRAREVLRWDNSPGFRSGPPSAPRNAPPAVSGRLWSPEPAAGKEPTAAWIPESAEPPGAGPGSGPEHVPGHGPGRRREWRSAASAPEPGDVPEHGEPTEWERDQPPGLDRRPQREDQPVRPDAPASGEQHRPDESQAPAAGYGHRLGAAPAGRVGRPVRHGRGPARESGRRAGQGRGRGAGSGYALVPALPLAVLIVALTAAAVLGGPRLFGPDGAGERIVAIPTTNAAPALIPERIGEPGSVDRVESAHVSPRLVRVADTVTDERAPRVAAMFETYFAGINAKDYQRVAEVLDPAGMVDPDDPEQMAAFSDGTATARDSRVVLRGLTDVGPGVLRADVSFRSRQDAGDGPPGRLGETCTDWRVAYTVSTGAAYRILRGQGTSAPC